MVLRLLHLARVSLVYSLVAALLTPQLLQAQSSIVQPSELKNAIEKASLNRARNLAQVRSFFSSKPVRNALSKTGMKPDRLNEAAASLSPDELARLAARTQKIQADFAAGALSNQELTYIVIALAAAVLVLIVVAAD
jgi:hypothetical protein